MKEKKAKETLRNIIKINHNNKRTISVDNVRVLTISYLETKLLTFEALFIQIK